MYARGEGVPLDYVTSYVWLMLAVNGGHEPSKKVVRDLERIMTPKQRKEAKARLASQDQSKRRTEGLGGEKHVAAVFVERGTPPDD
jgi:TPR repeat protein